MTTLVFSHFGTYIIECMNELLKESSEHRIPHGIDQCITLSWTQVKLNPNLRMIYFFSKELTYKFFYYLCPV